MGTNNSSISYMRDYLNFALQFEKHVYIWSNAMEDINSRMRRLYDERSRLEAEKLTAQHTISSLDSVNENRRRQTQQQIINNKKAEKAIITVIIVLEVLLFLIGCVVGYFVKDIAVIDVIPRVFYIPIFGVLVMIVGSLFTGILPICLIVFAVIKSKGKKLERVLGEISNQDSRRRQEMLLREQESQAENDWVVNVLEESVINKKQDEIHMSLQEATRTLDQIYSVNILPIKYRNMNAIATMYEYLATGRCNTIQGHGGIYDTYESERVQLKQLEQMVQMNQTLSRIEDNQRYIIRELQQANKALSGIKTSLREIEKTNTEIAHNTAISAAAAQQTAEAARWMAWRTWANGY